MEEEEGEERIQKRPLIIGQIGIFGDLIVKICFPPHRPLQNYKSKLISSMHYLDDGRYTTIYIIVFCNDAIL